MSSLPFWILSTITVLAVLFMVMQKNPITSAVLLVTSFFSLAGLYVLLDAHFIATLQILVYAGAIMVLFIFVIMLLNLKGHELTDGKIGLFSIVGTLAGIAVTTFLSFQFIRLPVNVTQGGGGFLPTTSNFGTPEQLGIALFTDYAMPMQFIGILLLIGIVGAILLGQKEKV